MRGIRGISTPHRPSMIVLHWLPTAIKLIQNCTLIFLSEIEELFMLKAIGIDVYLLQWTSPDWARRD